MKGSGRAVAACAAGALLGAATYVTWLWPVAPLSIAFLLWLTFSSSIRAAYAFGHAFGFGLMGAVFFWGFDTLPLTWLGIPDPVLGFVIMFAIWAVYSFLIATPVGVWSYAMHRFGNNLWLLLIAPVGWVVAEYAHALVHNLTTWGSGSALGVHLSFGFAGYAFSWSGFLWLARFGGVTALSFLAVFIGTSLYLAWKRRGASLVDMSIAPAVCVAVLLLVFGYGLPSPLVAVFDPPVVEVEGIRIVPVGTRIEPALTRTPEERETIAKEHVNLLDAALEENPDVIVLPEYVSFLKYESLLPKGVANSLRDVLHKNEILLIDSETTTGSVFGAISFFDGQVVRERQYKKLLIPLGEFFPYPLVFIFKHVGLNDELQDILRYRSYAPSRKEFSERIFEWKGVKLGVLACSESFSPFAYKAVSDAGADVLINVASHSWVRGKTQILFKETLAMARVHAVYTGKVFIQATNYGPSFVLYPYTQSE